ncbi:MAG: hypothetical protein M3Z05_16720, partial [Gemmatimonadota bacterium]|nr:hypothetical protein [Gemmatimonadota bacterium]
MERHIDSVVELSNPRGLPLMGPVRASAISPGERWLLAGWSASLYSIGPRISLLLVKVSGDWRARSKQHSSFRDEELIVAAVIAPRPRVA